jgi:hypothetical protein
MRHQTVVRLFSALRDAWLIFGIALVFFFALEGGYRLWTSVAAHSRARWVDDPRHPYHGQAWYSQLRAAIEDTRDFDFDPYRGYWARPMRSPYLNVDSAGHRLTVQPAPPPGARDIFMIGGSAMWGATVGDSFTVSSQLATVLARRGVTGYRVVSLAQPGFNSLQELATLELELAHGAHPAAVVLLNGFNDANTAVLTGRIGSTYAEYVGNQLIAMGKRGFWREILGAGRHSALVYRLLHLRPAPRRAPLTAEATCPPATVFYASMEHTVEALARINGFPALIFLQPHHTTTAKRLTPWEARLPKDMRIATCLTAFAGAMQPEAGRTFFDLRGVFDADTATVFVDTQSHPTQAATMLVSEAIADRLIPALQQNRAN